jgi:hypothetical protein
MHWWFNNLQLMYKPTVLVVHWAYTSVGAKCIGDSVTPCPMYDPTALVVHCLYTDVGANLVGDFVISGPV